MKQLCGILFLFGLMLPLCAGEGAGADVNGDNASLSGGSQK